MKVTFVITLVCVVLAVTMAAKVDKVAKVDKAARKAARMEKRMAKKAEKARCAPIVTWTACTGDTITQTILPTTAENCASKITEPVTNTLQCNTVQMKERKGCTYTRTADLTPCGAGEQTFTATLTAAPGCPNEVPAKKASKTIMCNRPFKMAATEKLRPKNKRKNRKPKKSADGRRQRGNRNQN